jgi:hypothetical protein
MKSKYKIDDFIDKTFELWTVVKPSHIDKKSQQFWICRCRCGVEKPVRASHIIRGISKGCSKCRGQSNSTIKSPFWKGGNFISSTLFTTYKIGAQNRNIEFNITLHDLEQQWNQQKGLCKYSNTILTLPKNTRDKTFNASLDRIDSSKGYQVDNIQWVTKEINLMKMNLTEPRFLELCKVISTCGV